MSSSHSLYSDADMDDYSTQDIGGESTEPEIAQGHTMYFGQDEEGSYKELRWSQRRYSEIMEYFQFYKPYVDRLAQAEVFNTGHALTATIQV